MKIYNPLNPIVNPQADRPSRTAGGQQPFQGVFQQKCQETGTAPVAAAASSPLELVGKVLDLLDNIASRIERGASAEDLNAPHEQLARQAERLKDEAARLQPGRLKDLADQTAALGYLQLVRFERAELD
ncbi:MAG: hypothetical protein V2A77_07765 [Pseudomonadota bacterium]